MRVYILYLLYLRMRVYILVFTVFTYEGVYTVFTVFTYEGVYTVYTVFTHSLTKNIGEQKIGEEHSAKNMTRRNFRNPSSRRTFSWVMAYLIHSSVLIIGLASSTWRSCRSQRGPASRLISVEDLGHSIECDRSCRHVLLCLLRTQFALRGPHAMARALMPGGGGSRGTRSAVVWAFGAAHSCVQRAQLHRPASRSERKALLRIC